MAKSGSSNMESQGDFGLATRGRERLWSSRCNVANDFLSR